mmetsp:Transcript_27177/g.71526  ORF Transcript_27177/g.71526 Transcript_27177/m.71526 type:complete len:261 (-) Transcript_27177:98-880(-)
MDLWQPDASDEESVDSLPVPQDDVGYAIPPYSAAASTHSFSWLPVSKGLSHSKSASFVSAVAALATPRSEDDGFDAADAPIPFAARFALAGDSRWSKRSLAARPRARSPNSLTPPFISASMPNLLPDHIVASGPVLPKVTTPLARRGQAQEDWDEAHALPPDGPAITDWCTQLGPGENYPWVMPESALQRHDASAICRPLVSATHKRHPLVSRTDECSYEDGSENLSDDEVRCCRTTCLIGNLARQDPYVPVSLRRKLTL